MLDYVFFLFTMIRPYLHTPNVVVEMCLIYFTAGFLRLRCFLQIIIMQISTHVNSTQITVINQQYHPMLNNLYLVLFSLKIIKVALQFAFYGPRKQI